jgi:hypothetical protein
MLWLRFGVSVLMELTGFGKFRLHDLVAGDIAVPEV